MSESIAKEQTSSFDTIKSVANRFAIKELLNHLKGDKVLWIVTLLLMGFSLLTVFSFVPILVKVEGGTPFKYLFKHFVYILLSVASMFWIHRVPPKYFSQSVKLAMYLAILLLVLTWIIPVEVNSAKRWIRVPFIGITFQAADFAKIALILYLAKQLDKRKDKFKDWKEGFLPIIGPIILVFLMIVKDNFSTAAIIFALAMALIFLGGFPISRILATFVIMGSVALLIVGAHKAFPDLNLLPRYTTWENRIINRVDSESKVVDNAQVINAKLAIYNGKWTGQGVGDGKLKEFLPEAYADFYYSSFVEEFGFISAVVLVFIYLIMLYRILQIGLKADSIFETYFSFGIGMLLMTQASVNMLVCTGVFPVTGQNMPFLAMGGSAMIMTSLAIGMVQSIAVKQQNSTNDKSSSEEEE
jgi:cell division protein FtsW